LADNQQEKVLRPTLPSNASSSPPCPGSGLELFLDAKRPFFIPDSANIRPSEDAIDIAKRTRPQLQADTCIDEKQETHGRRRSSQRQLPDHVFLGLTLGQNFGRQWRDRAKIADNVGDHHKRPATSASQMPKFNPALRQGQSPPAMIITG